MSDFEVIPDEERLPSRGFGMNATPVHEAIAAGKTVFIPFNGRPEQSVRNGLHGFATKRGLSAHSRKTERDGVEGLIAWAEPKADR